MGDGAVAWLRDRTGHALDVQAIGPVAIAPGGVIVVDPLTYSTGYDWPFLAAPEGPAQFLVALDAESGRVSKAALVFSDAPVACGHDEATVGVDTGLAAFLDRPAAAALEADSQALGPGRDIYNDWFHGLIGETRGARIAHGGHPVRAAPAHHSGAHHRAGTPAEAGSRSGSGRGGRRIAGTGCRLLRDDGRAQNRAGNKSSKCSGDDGFHGKAPRQGSRRR